MQVYTIIIFINNIIILFNILVFWVWDIPH
nr:MAG TPA: ATP synthase B/B' [Bacteriophage sp.]